MFKYLFTNKKLLVLNLDGAVITGNGYFDAVDGLYRFIVSTTEELQTKICVVSDLSENETNKILAELELENTFHFKQAPKNLNHLKKLTGVKEDEMLIFTNDPGDALWATKHNVTLVVVNKGDIPEDAYGNKVAEFVLDYSPFLGQLTQDDQEALLEQAKAIKDTIDIAS